MILPEQLDSLFKIIDRDHTIWLNNEYNKRLYLLISCSEFTCKREFHAENSLSA